MTPTKPGLYWVREISPNEPSNLVTVVEVVSIDADGRLDVWAIGSEYSTPLAESAKSYEWLGEAIPPNV